MRIGILTFHWSTNYGAVLQTFCLQSYLELQGHDVEVINYKPHSYDFDCFYFFRHPSQIMCVASFLRRVRKEKKLDVFRKKYLHLTKRVSKGNQIDKLGHYDIVIAGSDQVLNPSFSLYGDGAPTGVYFLNTIKNETKKVAYAVSFGCANYPNDVMQYAKSWVRNFDKVGVREKTGKNIFEDLGYKNKLTLVPDPVVLYGDKVLDELIAKRNETKDYICIYTVRRSIIIPYKNVVVIDDIHTPLSMEDWLLTITNSKVLVTNSYHGMIVAILKHVPFVVDLEKKTGHGMNDRFMTLLGKLNLTDRIASNDIDIIRLIKNDIINWNDVDERLNLFRSAGNFFFKEMFVGKD